MITPRSIAKLNYVKIFQQNTIKRVNLYRLYIVVYSTRADTGVSPESQLCIEKKGRK